jgi:hypothetical protein
VENSRRGDLVGTSPDKSVGKNNKGAMKHVKERLIIGTVYCNDRVGAFDECIECSVFLNIAVHNNTKSPFVVHRGKMGFVIELQTHAWL